MTNGLVQYIRMEKPTRQIGEHKRSIFVVPASAWVQFSHSFVCLCSCQHLYKQTERAEVFIFLGYRFFRTCTPIPKKCLWHWPLPWQAWHHPPWSYPDRHDTTLHEATLTGMTLPFMKLPWQAWHHPPWSYPDRHDTTLHEATLTGMTPPFMKLAWQADTTLYEASLTGITPPFMKLPWQAWHHPSWS